MPLIDAIYQLLRNMAERHGKTMNEVLRDAEALEHWLAEVRENGAELVMPGGRSVTLRC